MILKVNNINKKVINQQKCTRKFYLEEDEEIQILFSIISKPANAIQYYLENNILNNILHNCILIKNLH